MIYANVSDLYNMCVYTYSSRSNTVIVIDGFTAIVVISQPTGHEVLVEHVTAEQHLTGIVVDERATKAQRFSVAHVYRSNDHHPRQICENHAQRR